MPTGVRPRDAQELLSKPRVRLVIPTPEGCPGCRLRLADAAHLRAEVDRREVTRDAVRLEDARNRVGDFAPHPLLDGEPPSEEAHQPGELGDADDVLVGDVAQIGVAEERKGVVLAKGVKRNGPFNDLAEVTIGTAVAFR